MDNKTFVFDEDLVDCSMRSTIFLHGLPPIEVERHIRHIPVTLEDGTPIMFKQVSGGTSTLR